jgi:hypothetical protein
VNLPIVGIATILVVFFLKLHFKSTSLLSKLGRVDWVGIFLFVASLTGFLIPITWGGVQYSWSSYQTLVPLLVSICGLVLFWLWEEFMAAEPLIRPATLKNRTAAVTYFGIFVQGLVLWCVIYYEPLYFQGVKGYTMIASGVAAFPQTFTIAPAAVIVGFVVAKVGKYRWAIWLGWFLTTLGTGLMILLDVHTSIPAWIFLNLVGGLGIGILYPSLSYGVQASSADANMAYAATLAGFFRSFGQTVGVAVGGSVFQNQLKKKMLAYPLLAPLANEYSRNANGLIQIIRAMPADSPVRIQLIQSYADALKVIWVVVCAFSGVALIASFWTQELDLNRDLVTEQGFVHEETTEDEEKVAA